MGRSRKQKNGDDRLKESINEMLRKDAADNDEAEAYESALTKIYGQRRVVDMLGNPIKGELPRIGERRVTLMRDSTLEYPDLFLEIFLTGPAEDQRGFAHMFARSGCKKAESIEDSDLVVFTGGADVDPRLYGEEPHRSSRWSEARDNEDILTYLQCVEEGIPMLGICRGAQFLHVMNGGKLFQDVDNHNGDHPVFDHIHKKMVDKVSSVHHQMCIENIKGGMEIIATSSKATKRWRNPLLCLSGSVADVEAFFYRDTCCLGIQGHPEYSGYHYFTKWCLDLINDYVIMNPDIDWVHFEKKEDGKPRSYRRVRDDLLVERKARLKSVIEKRKGEQDVVIDSPNAAGAASE